MDYAERLAVSYYKTIADINRAHQIYLVQHQESRKIYIKKILDVYNPDLYRYLQHHGIAGIPRVYQVYEEDGQLTIIEEFISGTTLQELIDAKVLSVDFIVRIMSELCDILEQLHNLNPPIIHRDLKPSNVIITSCRHVVLIDFNAAKYLNEKSAQDTVLLGTKGYAAPEQYGFGPSTPQTDIYALGMVLKDLSSASAVPTNQFDDLIRRCTQVNPSDRPENVRMLKAEICRSGGAADPGYKGKAAKRKTIAPPGFRTRTPWKIWAASIVYVFIFWLSLTLEVKDVTAAQLWIERIFCLLMMLSIVFCCFDYCNIQQVLPLCRDRRRPVRYLGILLLNLAAVIFLLLIMLLAVSLF